MDFVKRLLTSLFLGANLCSILLLWACCLSTLLPPERFPLLSLMGLSFPAILLVNVGFLLFWLIFKIRYTLLPLAGLLAVGSYILDYFPLNRTSQAPEDALTVISYNTGELVDEEDRAGFTRFVEQHKPDILCLQEFPYAWTRRDEAQRLIDSLGYKSLRDKDNYIYTRLRILGDPIHIAHDSISQNTFMACWVEYDGDSLLIINNHLESNKLDDKDKNEYREMIKDPHRQTVKEGSRHLLTKLSKAAAKRSRQTDILCHLADSLQGHHIILCGDLNDTPISYTYQQLARRLSSVYRQSGRGFGRSFNQSGFPVRIDHIFVSNQWTSSNTYIDPQLDISDHYPIITHIQKK